MSLQPNTKTKSPGVVRVLSSLTDTEDLSRIRTLNDEDITVLLAAAQGASVDEVIQALHMSKNDPPASLLTAEDREILKMGRRVKITVASYLTNVPLQNAYPIDKETFDIVKAHFEEGRHESAVNTLLKAIDASRADAGKTKRVVVEVGALKTSSTAYEFAKKLHDSIGATYKSMGTTCSVDGDVFVCSVRGYNIRGLNSKLVKMVTRCVMYFVDTGRRMEELMEIPGVEVVSVKGTKSAEKKIERAGGSK